MKASFYLGIELVPLCLQPPEVLVLVRNRELQLLDLGDVVLLQAVLVHGGRGHRGRLKDDFTKIEGEKWPGK